MLPWDASAIVFLDASLSEKTYAKDDMAPEPKKSPINSKILPKNLWKSSAMSAKINAIIFIALMP